jgi:hypothetical protein
LAFFPSTTVPGTYGLAVYNSDATVAQVMHNTGTISALSPDVLFYIGSGFYGNVIPPRAAFNYLDGAVFTGVTRNPSSQQVNDYQSDNGWNFNASAREDVTFTRYQAQGGAVEATVTLSAADSFPGGGAVVSVLDQDGGVVEATNGGAFSQFSDEVLSYTLPAGYSLEVQFFNATGAGSVVWLAAPPA